MSPPEPRRPTIRDVAAAAGVSPTTVSHALNGKGQVAAAVRRRVEDEAERLGYRASRSARALRAGRTGTVALLVPTVAEASGPDDPAALGLDYYMRLAAGAARAAAGRGRPLLLSPPLRTAADVVEMGVDGAIVCDPRERDPQLGLLLEAGLPAVSVEHDAGRPEHRDVVHGDAPRATRALLDHLRERGARRPALLGLDVDWAWARETEAAHAAWCAEHGLDVLLARSDPTALGESARRRATTMLAAGEPPDAILALAEGSALGVLHAARAAGRDVPGDLLLVAGIDDPGARLAEPAITALDPLPDAQGAAAAELLLRLVDGEDPPRPVVVEPRLRVRASSGG